MASSWSKPLTIGLIWHSLSSENLGVGALTIAHMRLIRRAAERTGRAVNFVIVGPGGALDYSDGTEDIREKIAVDGKGVINPASRLHRAIRGSDIVLDIGSLLSWRRESSTLVRAYEKLIQ